MSADGTMEFDARTESSQRVNITIKGDHLKTLLRLHGLAVALIPLLGSSVAIALALRWGIGPVEVGLLVGMYTLTGIGVTVGLHRYFAHHAFQTHTTVRIMLAILGSMAGQGPPIYWVATHRRHHEYSDVPGDPHSPHLKGGRRLGLLRGLWHAHMGWTFNHDITNTAFFAKDLLRDQTISKINERYYVCMALGFALPALLGGFLIGGFRGILCGFLWGGMVRLLFSYHLTMSVNSMGHRYGRRAFNTRDHSTNIAWLAIPTLGELWHNNHHAFPGSAVFGLERGQIDIGGWVIRALETLGLAWNVKVPSADRIAAQNAKNG